MSETATRQEKNDQFWYDQGYKTALEWAAGQAAEQAKGWREEARGQGGVEYKERARRIAQELDALAAKIREGAP